MIKITEINTIDKLAKYQKDWNLLLAISETNVIFLRYEWLLSYLQSFGQNDKLLVLIAEEDSQIIGIAPLSISTRRRLWGSNRTVRFIGSHFPDYNDFIASKEVKDRVLPAMFSHLLSIRNRWDIVKLNEVPDVSSTVALCKRFASQNFRFWKARDASSCPQLITQGNEEEIRKNLLRRKDFKFRHNWLKRQGNLEYRDCGSVEDVLSILNTYFSCHIARWEQTETKSLFYDATNREFFSVLIKNMFPTGCLKFTVLSLDGLPLAFCFGFEYERMFIRYKSTFNNAFRKRSPGMVLLKLAIEEAIQKSMRGIDYTRGLEDYKMELSNSRSQNKCIFLYNNVFTCVLNEIQDRIRQSSLLKKLHGKQVYWQFRRVIRGYWGRYHLWFGLKIIQRLSHRILIYSRSYLFAITELAEETVEAKCPLHIQKATMKDIWLVVSLYGCDEDSHKRQVIEDAFEKGDECFLVFEGKNLAHCSWVRRGGSIGLSLNQLYRHQLGQNEACIYNCETSSVYRGMHIYPAVLQYIHKQCFAQGVKKIYICCDIQNIASVRGIERAGFRRERIIRVMKVFGKKLFAR